MICSYGLAEYVKEKTAPPLLSFGLLDAIELFSNLTSRICLPLSLSPTLPLSFFHIPLSFFTTLVGSCYVYVERNIRTCVLDQLKDKR